MNAIYRDKRTTRFARGERVPAFSGFERTAERRLRVLISATSLNDLRMTCDKCRDGDSKPSKVIERVNGPFASTINGGFALRGLKILHIRSTSKSLITIEIENAHGGQAGAT